MAEHWSNLKPAPIACPCGCPVIGQPRVKQWQDGLGAHVRGCQCRRCAGGRQRPRSRVRENRVAKDTGGERSPLSGATNGYDGRAGLWRWEETSNVAITRGFMHWIQGKGVQSKVARLMAIRGVKRALILSVDNKPTWVVIPYEDWAPDVKESV